MSYKVLVLTNGGYYSQILEDAGIQTVIVPVGWKGSPEGFDGVMFTGGTDVNPSLYGEKRDFLTSPSDHYRDRFEKDQWHKAKELGLPCFGICRGLQFLAVMNGCKLIQHVENHDQGHEVITIDGEVFYSRAGHHQAVNPKTLRSGHQLIATSVFEEPVIESLYFPDTKDFGVQFHPEWHHKDDPAPKFFKKWVLRLLKDRTSTLP